MRWVYVAGAFIVFFGAGVAVSSWTLVCRAGRCPSVGVLEAYTPRQTSKLYAADGRFIAELGLERRTLITLDRDPARGPRRLRRHRGQALLLAPRHRLHPRVRRRAAQPAARRLRAGLLDDHDAAGAQRLSRADLAREDAGAQAQGSQGRAGDRAPVLQGPHPRAVPEPDLPRQRRVRRGDGVAALLRQVGPRSQPRRGGHAGRAAQGPEPLQPASLSRSRRPAPQHDHRADAPGRAGRATPTPVLAKAYPLQLARPQPSRATSRRTSSNGCASSSTPGSASGCTSRDSRSTPRSTSTCSRPPNARSRRSCEPSRRGSTAPTSTRRSSSTWPAPRGAGARRRRTRRTCRARSWRWIRAPAPCAPWSAAATSTTRSSTAPPRRCASRDPPSSRSSTPPRSRPGMPPSYLVDDEPLAVPQIDGTDWTPQNFDLKFEGPMTMRRALLSVAQPGRHSHRHGARRAERDRRGAQVRHHDAHSALSVDPHRLRRRLPDRDDLRLLHLRHPRHARHAHRHPPRRERRRKGALAAGPAAEHDPARRSRRGSWWT